MWYNNKNIYIKFKMFKSYFLDGYRRAKSNNGK